MWNGHKDRQILQWNWIKGPDQNLFLYRRLNEEMTVFPTVGTNITSHGRKHTHTHKQSKGRVRNVAWLAEHLPSLQGALGSVRSWSLHNSNPSIWGWRQGDLMIKITFSYIASWSLLGLWDPISKDMKMWAGSTAKPWVQFHTEELTAACNSSSGVYAL